MSLGGGGLLGCQLPQQETGSRYCIGGWGRGARRQPGPTCRGTGSEGSELWSRRWSHVLMLPALRGPACPLCPPSEWRQLLPLAQALRARRALPPGERQGDLAPKRETDRREREASRPGSSSERRGRLGQAGAGPLGTAVSAAAAALGLGCSTHRPVARACRSGPRTGA